MKSRRTDSDLEEASKPSSMYLSYSSGTGPVQNSNPIASACHASEL